MSGAHYKDPKSALTEGVPGECVFPKYCVVVRIEVIEKADTMSENL